MERDKIELLNERTRYLSDKFSDHYKNLAGKIDDLDDKIYRLEEIVNENKKEIDSIEDGVKKMENALSFVKGTIKTLFVIASVCAFLFQVFKFALEK